MRNAKFITVVTFSILTFFILTSCEKEDISQTGKLNVSFTNHPSDIIVLVYSISNTAKYFQRPSSAV
jgi:hypothetical protein